MKFIIVFIFMGLSMSAISQTNPFAVSFSGIGKLKLGMTPSEVEKLTGKTIVLKQVSDEGIKEYDTVSIDLENVNMKILFRYTDENKLILDEIISNDSRLRTKSRVGIGDDKYKIINTYTNHSITVDPLERVGKEASCKISVHSKEPINIVFILTNNKIKSLSVAYEKGVNSSL